MGWTGGQYSIYRALLALVTASLLCAIAEGSGLRGFVPGVLGAACCTALLVGWRDRAAACGALLCLGLEIGLSRGVGALTSSEMPGVVLLGLLILLHAATPGAPYGSWDARGRVDPGGGWARPSAISDAAWTLLALVSASRVLRALALGPSAVPGPVDLPLIAAIGLLFELAVVAAALYRPARAGAWTALGLWRIACLTATGSLGPPGDGILLLLLFSAFEPAWWIGRSLAGRTSAAARLYYDGDCGFCHRSVRFVLAEDAQVPVDQRLRFSPLASETFESRVAQREDVDVAALPDSIILELPDGQLLTRSSAALEIASRLGGLWRGIAVVARWIPSGLLDLLYDGIARIRKRLFAAPKEACPILPPSLRARFDFQAIG